MRSQEFRANLAWVNSEFGSPLSRLSGELLGKWFPFHEKPPEHLYHYTTVEGLLGILGSSALWATNIAYLNDASELAYAHSLIQSELTARLASVSSPVGREFLERCKRAIDPDDGMFQYFVACFCEHPDLLSQWRGYSSNAGGYAIGFETFWMRQLADPSPQLALRRVIYGEEQQRALVSNAIGRTVALLEALAGEKDVAAANTMIAMFVSCLRDHLAEFHLAFKNKAFEDEREWRLILMANLLERDQLLSKLEFRAVRGSPVPYVKVQFCASAGPQTGLLPISRVRFGPTIDAAWARQALELLLRKTGYTFTEIDTSAVPLRF